MFSPSSEKFLVLKVEVLETPKLVEGKYLAKFLIILVRTKYKTDISSLLRIANKMYRLKWVVLVVYGSATRFNRSSPCFENFLLVQILKNMYLD